MFFIDSFFRELQLQGSEETTDEEAIKKSIREGLHLRELLASNGILKKE